MGPTRAIVVLLAGAALLASAVAAAWLCDDALITLRVVDNLYRGHGLGWNAGERTQVSVHPLWTALLALAHLLPGSSYGLTIGCGLGCTAATVGLLIRGGGATAAVAALLGSLCCSRAFVDYSTGGLENPLCNALLVAFAALALREPAEPSRLRRLALLASAVWLCRIDLGPLLLPALLMASRGQRPAAALSRLGLGLAPLLAWLCFALLYFGTAIPVPGYAKLLTAGVPLAVAGAQGLRYLLDLLVRDPTSALLIAAGIAAAWRRRAGRPLALGMVLQLGYLVSTGGDYMTGRFFTPLLATSAAVLATEPWLRRGLAPLLATALAAGLTLATGELPALRPLPDEAPIPGPGQANRIGDERAFYVRALGLWSPHRPVLAPGSFSDLQRAQGRTRPLVAIAFTVGMNGWLAGDLVHVVDPYLCDPLLCRLPAVAGEPFRPGHLRRRLPEGYLESLAHGENRIEHPGLRRYYEALHTVIAAPVLSTARLRTLVDFWCGRFDQGLADYVASDYLEPPTVVVASESLAAVPADGTPWHDWRPARVVLSGGLWLQFPAPQRGSALRLSLDGGDQYRLEFWRGAALLGECRCDSASGPFGGLGRLRLPLDATVQDFDRIRVHASVGGDSIAAVAHVAIDP